MWGPLLLVAVASSLCVHCAAAAAVNKLPESFPRCKQDDPKLNECIKKATQTVIPQLRDGISSIGVASLDPLHVTSIKIGQGQGPISINIALSNCTVKGLSDAQVSTAETDLQKYSLLFDGAIKKVTLESSYDMSGRILLLPVTGKGPCKLTFTNLRAKLGPKGKGKMKKGENYFNVDELFLDIHGLDKLEVHFENLFNGDKTLGASMNNLLNENWRDLWSELRPAFEETFAAIFLQYSKGIFDKVTFKDIFLE